MILSIFNKPILVTRPSPQGELLCELLNLHHIPNYYLPAFTISPRPVSSFFDEPDICIFMSANAVTHYPFSFFPCSAHYFAVGKATAFALSQYGLVAKTPALENSEGLLALKELQQVENKKIAIFCGLGGRDLLYSSLLAKKANCQRYEVYERHYSYEMAERLPFLLKTVSFFCIVCTSVENLICLDKLAGNYSMALKKTPILVASQRIADQAYKQGFLEIRILQAAIDNQSIVNFLLKWRKEYV